MRSGAPSRTPAFLGHHCPKKHRAARARPRLVIFGFSRLWRRVAGLPPHPPRGSRLGNSRGPFELQLEGGVGEGSAKACWAVISTIVVPRGSAERPQWDSIRSVALQLAIKPRSGRTRIPLRRTILLTRVPHLRSPKTSSPQDAEGHEDKDGRGRQEDELFSMERSPSETERHTGQPRGESLKLRLLASQTHSFRTSFSQCGGTTRSVGLPLRCPQTCQYGMPGTPLARCLTHSRPPRPLRHPR